MEQTRYYLGLHEWIAVIIIVSVLFSISLVAIISGVLVESSFETDKFFIKEQTKPIKITGAVESPGTYLVESTTIIKDAIQLAKPLPQAELHRLPLDQEVGKKRTINVPSQPKVAIHISGAIKGCGEMTVPKGTKVIDLISMIDFEEDADKNALKKQRKLKEGEQIVVPKL